jgi:hypothetical protein
MNFEEILKSKNLINYIIDKIKYREQRDRVEYFKFNNIHGLYLSSIIYDYLFKTNTQSDFDLSCFLYSSVKHIDKYVDFNFNNIVYLTKYKMLVYSDDYLDFLKSKQLKILNFNSVDLESNINNLIKYKYIYKDCFLDIVDIVDYATTCCDQSLKDRLVTNASRRYLIDYYNIENNQLTIKANKYDSLNKSIRRYSPNEANSEIYFLLNNSNKNDKSMYQIIFKYNPFSYIALGYIRYRTSSFKNQYLKNVIDDAIFYYNMFVYCFKLNYIYHVNHFLNLKNDYLYRCSFTDLIEFDLLVNKLNNFIMDHSNLIPLFDCTLKEQIERYDVINYWVEKEGTYVIGILETAYMYDYALTFSKWVNSQIKKFKSESEEILVEPLPIKDKYLGCKIHELYTRRMLTEEGVANHNCVGGYSINENRRIFSLRYQNIRITCELVYCNSTWKATQTLGYGNKKLSSHTEEVQRKIKYILNYLISQLILLYNPSKNKNICQL